MYSKNSQLVYRQLLLLYDIALTILAFIFAYYFREWLVPFISKAGTVQLTDLRVYILLIALTWWVLLYAQDVYRLERFSSLGSEIFILVRTMFWGTLILLLIGYLVKDWSFPRTLLIIFLISNFLFLTIGKYLIYLYIKNKRRNGQDRKKVLIVGDGDIAIDFVHRIADHPGWGMAVIGYLSDDPNKVGLALNGSKVIGTYDQFLEILHANFIEEVIIALPPEYFKYMRPIFEICEREGVCTRVISRFLNNVVSHLSVDVIEGYPVLSFSPYQNKELQALLKRVFDIAISGILLIPLGLIVFPIISLLIRLDSPGPVFYSWRVVGRDKKRFNSYKFRTMYIDADERKKELIKQNEMSGPVFKIKNDPRITRVGKYLRKYSLDELPQLWSVFKGDMSLVGPRPPLQTEVPKFESWHRRKLSVKPGITCLWQVAGRNAIKNFDDWVKLDLEYIDNWSLWLDIKILLRTVPVVLFGRGH